MIEVLIPNLSLVKNKVHCRRRLVYSLALRGIKQKEIAKRLNCSLSTIEKDFRHIRENNKWKREDVYV